jgi:hypothetical protein
MRKVTMAQETTREALYRELMGKAGQVAPAQTVVVMPVAPVENYFFPWEQAQYHANGTTSAENTK